MSAEQRVTARYLKRVKTAGEVRFIKDRGGEKGEWGWGSPGPTEREISSEFAFNPKYRKPLAEVLRASLAALGHVQSAYNTFTKVKSATVSPDGALGGKGYIQKITDMRRQFMNCSEAISALTDTLYDEINAPHWDPAVKEQGSREREQVKDIMEDVETIRQDPEGWAEEEETEMGDSEPKEGQKKTATQAGDDATRVAVLYLQRRDA